MNTQYLGITGGHPQEQEKKKRTAQSLLANMHRQGTKQFKEDEVLKSDGLMSSTSSVSIGSKDASPHIEVVNLSQKEGTSKQMSLLGSRKGQRDQPKRNHSQSRVSHQSGAGVQGDSKAFLSVAQINEHLNQRDMQYKKYNQEIKSLRRASTVQSKQVDINQLRKQFQMNLIVENLEKKKIHAHDTISLISHMEHMLNPLAAANSPKFMKKDSFQSINSKASQNKKGGKDVDRLSQNGSCRDSIHTDNDKGTKSPSRTPTMKRKHLKDHVKPTLLSQIVGITEKYQGSLLGISRAPTQIKSTDKLQVQPSRTALGDEKKQSGNQIISINFETESNIGSNKSLHRNEKKAPTAGFSSFNRQARGAVRVDDSREILQDTSKELSVINKHSELDDVENLGLPLPLFGKKESFTHARQDQIPKIEIDLATPMSSVKLLADNAGSPPMVKNQSSLRGGVASHNLLDVDHIYTKSHHEEPQSPVKYENSIEVTSKHSSQLENSGNKSMNRRFSMMMPVSANMRKAETIMAPQAMMTQSTFKKKADVGGPSGSKGRAGFLKAGTLNPLAHGMNDQKRHSTMINDHGNYQKHLSIMPQGGFIFGTSQSQMSAMNRSPTKQTNENYYKIENMEALKADPRMWAAGDTFFTPWDIAKLNHLYAMGKKNPGQIEVQEQDQVDESFRHKMKKKLYHFLNLEHPSDEEGGLDEIKDIKTPPFSSGESEEEFDQEVAFVNMKDEEKRARMLDLFRRMTAKAVGGAQIIRRFQELRENISMFGASRRVAVDIEDEIEPLPFILLPDNKFRMAWNVVTMILLLYTASFVPYRTSFIEEAPPGLVAWEWIIDALFVIDIFINFISAYENTDKNIEVRLKEIARTYVLTWFLFDLAAVFPFQLLEDSSEAQQIAAMNYEDTSFSDITTPTAQSILKRRQQADNQNINKLIRLARLPRLYRLMRILRLFKIFSLLKNNASFKKLQEAINMNVGIQRMIAIALVVVFTVHLMACLFFLVSKFEEEDQDNWVIYSGIQDEDPSYQYLVSLYWALQTLTTVGYGDVTPRSVYEKIAGLIWMIIGVGFYSFTIGNLASIFNSIDTKAADLQQKLAILAEFSKRNKIPEEVQNKVKIFLENNHGDHMSLNNQKNLLSEVPASMRAEVVSHTHAEIIKRIRFFNQKDPAFLFAILPLLKPMKIYAKDQLYCQGDYAEEIFFIFEGRIKLHFDLNENHFGQPVLVPFNLYIEGSYFGDSDVFVENQRNIRDSTAQADVRSELLVITRLELQGILERFKKIEKEMRMIGVERKKHHIKSIQSAINNNQHKLVEMQQEQSLKVEAEKVESGNLVTKMLGSFGGDMNDDSQDNNRAENAGDGGSPREGKGTSQFAQQKLRLKSNQFTRPSIMHRGSESGQRPDVKREILQVISLMKSNNVLPDQVNSTIKHILDVKDEVGTFEEMAAKRRGGIMFKRNDASQQHLPISLDFAAHASSSSHRSKSKHKKKNRGETKENRSSQRKQEEQKVDDSIHTDPASDDDREEQPQQPVTKMPYGLKRKSDSKKPPQQPDAAQKSFSFDPVEVEVQKKPPPQPNMLGNDIVDEATSEEEQDSMDQSTHRGRGKQRGNNRRQKDELAVQAAEEMQDDIMWDITNQEILQGFQENMALIAANSFEILQLYELISTDYNKVTQRLKNAEEHVDQIQNRTDGLEEKLGKLLTLID